MLTIKQTIKKIFMSQKSNVLTYLENLTEEGWAKIHDFIFGAEKVISTVEKDLPAAEAIANVVAPGNATIATIEGDVTTAEGDVSKIEAVITPTQPPGQE